MNADPLCDESGPDTFWTTTNISEAMPGVLTPLGWSLWGPASDMGARRAMVRLGIFPRSEIRRQVPVDERFAGIFFGRAALNVDTYRRVADLTPGSSAEDTELQLLGTAREGVASSSTWRRLPFVAAGLPSTFLTEPRRMARFVASQRRWWQEQIVRTDPSTDRLLQAVDRLETALERHCIATVIALAMYDQVAKLAAAAGVPGLETRLVTGYGGLEEQQLVSELWELSRQRIGLEAILAQHGFHGPGEVSSHSWREDPDALARTAARYRELPDDASPSRVATRQVAEREEAERQLLAALPLAKRLAAKPVLGFARRAIPLREAGKAAYLMGFDAFRAGARTLGRAWAGAGTLGDPDDVFFLTLPELQSPPGDARALVAERRARRAEYEELELPGVWTGRPTPVPRARRTHGEGPVLGTPVAPGVVEAPARVAKRLDEAQDIELGEVLVCHTTDPSWASVFPLVGALAIDVGTTASHGAIVARELGIPCVINTTVGTDVFSTGDVVRLDGAKGTVELVSRLV